MALNGFYFLWPASPLRSVAHFAIRFLRKCIVIKHAELVIYLGLISKSNCLSRYAAFIVPTPNVVALPLPKD